MVVWYQLAAPKREGRSEYLYLPRHPLPRRPLRIVLMNDVTHSSLTPYSLYRDMVQLYVLSCVSTGPTRPRREAVNSDATDASLSCSCGLNHLHTPQFLSPSGHSDKNKWIGGVLHPRTIARAKTEEALELLSPSRSQVESSTHAELAPCFAGEAKVFNTLCTVSLQPSCCQALSRISERVSKSLPSDKNRGTPP